MSKIKKTSSLAHRRTNVRPAVGNQPRSGAQNTSDNEVNNGDKRIVPPRGVIHICSICQFKNGSHQRICFPMPYSNFRGAVDEEIRLQTTEEEKERLLNAQVAFWKGEITEEQGKFATFAFLTSSPMVIRWTLKSFSEEQSFGIIINFIEGRNKHKTLCMPTDKWYLFLHELDNRLNQLGCCQIR